MYCGNCFRDNSLVRVLRQMGHHAIMVPLYLPMSLEEEDQSAGTPIFFGGVNVYLEQVSPLFRKMPGWLHRWLASPKLLKWAAGRAAKTRAQDVGALTVSMLRGEEGNQARELDELVGWLKDREKPDVVCLSNALLVGMARRLKQALGAPVVCTLQGEDSFLDSLPAGFRDLSWRTLAERAKEVDLFIAPSRYFGDLMRGRLKISAERLRVVHNGINLEGWAGEKRAGEQVIGYFARMCREKGLDTLVEAFLLLKKRPRMERVRLHVGGGCGPADQSFVASLQQRLQSAGVIGDACFFPNVDRAGKLEFFRSIDIFSVPALYGEAFGLYIIEAMAAGVPVVQPRVAAFPELVEATGGGVLCEPNDPKALADALEQMLLNPNRTLELGQRGQASVRENFSQERMAENFARELVAVGEL